MERFRNDAFSNVSTFETVSGVFGRFSFDDRLKRIKTYAFSNENALVWVGSESHTGASQVTASLVAVNVTGAQTHTAVM